jgi:hypothetical protein
MVTRHEKSFVDYDKPYETNLIGLRGIVYFGVGLFLLIVITFGLMWVMLDALESDAKKRDEETANPLRLSDTERLPPEPRLQVAPGFRVEGPNGPVNLELREPQSEYSVLEQQWEEILKNGEKDAQTGTVISLSIDEAKQRLLQRNDKAKTDEEAQKTLEDARTVINDSSSGRADTIRIR